MEFACEYDGQYEGVYRELLTYDMYLREKLKSRPDFAKDLGAYKDCFRDFYKQEEECREYLPAYETYDSKQLSRMTHLEPFTYPVWERMKRDVTSATTAAKEDFVLFDYQERSPLTGEARTVVVGCEILKAKRNAEYLAMLDKSIAEAEAGGFIAKKQAELGE